MNAWRWFIRAFFARIGWVIAGLLLLLLGVDARADPSCPENQSSRWTVTSKDVDMPCSVGQTFGSASAFQAACLPAHGTANSSNGYLHYDGVQACTYDGTASSACSRSYSHSPTHGYSSTAGTANATHSCVVPACNSVAGADMGMQSLASYNKGESTACIDDCKVTRKVVMDFSETGGGLSDAYRWESSGEVCASERRTVGTPDVCKTLTGTSGSSTACATNTNKKLISDGKRPNERTPEKDDWEYSGAPADVLRDEGCVVVESGRAICLASAPAAVRPDNGTPGVPATPTSTAVYHAPYGLTNNSSTTVHIYNNSSVSSSTNYGTGAPPVPDGQGDSDNDGVCDYGENSNSTDCKGGGGDGEGEGGGGDCDPEVETCSFSAPTGLHDFGDWADEIAQGEADLATEIANVRAEALDMFDGLLSSGDAKLPCTSFSMWGKTIDFCFEPFEEHLLVLRQILLLMAALFCVAVLLR